MGELWDAFINIPKRIWDLLKEIRKADIIAGMKIARTQTALDRQYGKLSEEDKVDPEVLAAYEHKKEEIKQDRELGMFGSMPVALYEGFDAIKDTIESKIGETLEDALKPGSPEITEIFEGAMDTLLDGLLNAIDPGKVKISSDLRKEIKETMKPLLNLGLTFTVGTSLAELIHPTKELGFGRVSHFLYDTVGFKSLMDAYIEPIQMNLIRQPTKYSINELTRPFIPKFPDALEWYGRGHIDENEMDDLIKKHGVEEGWLRAYTRMGTKPSSYFMLNAIGREGLYDEADFKFWLSDAGYGAFQITTETLSKYEVKYGLEPPKTTQIDFLAAAYKRMAERIQWAGIQPLSKKAYKEGLMDIETLRKHLELSYRFKEVDDLEIQLLDQDILEDVNKEYRRAYERKYLAGRITKDELEKLLIEHGLREERAKARIEYMFARKEGKLAVDVDEKVLTKAEVIRAYRLKQKDKGWAIKQIDDQGYTIGDAELLVDYIDIEKADDVVDEWIRAYETRTVNGRMTISDFKAELIELGKDEAWAEARSMYVLERFLGKEEIPVPPEVVKQGITIYSKPSMAKIFIDGVNTGKLTTEKLDLSPGVYTIRLELAGYETAEVSVVIPIGVYIETRVELVKIPVPPVVVEQGATIYSKPSMAKIFVDDVDTRKLTTEKLDLSPGVHTIRLELAGYETAEVSVDIPIGVYIETRVELVKIPVPAS